MRLLLVGNYAPDEQVSMLRYAEMLRAAMAARGHMVELVQPQAVLLRLPWPNALRKWIAYVDKYLIFPRTLQTISRRFDLIHICDHSNAVYLPHVSGAASISCHDLLAILSAKGRYLQNPVSSTGRVLQRWIAQNLVKARNVACVSTETARELVALRGGPAEHLTVILNPLNFRYEPAEAGKVIALRQQLGAEERGYLLHVGGDHWYKNRPGVVRIYAALCKRLAHQGSEPPLLVMAGKAWPVALRALVAALGLQQSVVELVEPSNEELRVLYTGATALLFPSLYEGFGWPILEAQSCGCPVITTDREPMVEVAGGAALLIDPANEVEAGERIATALPELAKLREGGFANLARFDQKKVMDAYERFFLQSAGLLR